MKDILKERPQGLGTVEELNSEYRACQLRILQTTQRLKELKVLYLWAKHPEIKPGVWVHEVLEGKIMTRSTWVVRGITNKRGFADVFGFDCVKIGRDGRELLESCVFSNVALSKKQPEPKQ